MRKMIIALTATSAFGALILGAQAEGYHEHDRGAEVAGRVFGGIVGGGDYRRDRDHERYHERREHERFHQRQEHNRYHRNHDDDDD